MLLERQSNIRGGSTIGALKPVMWHYWALCAAGAFEVGSLMCAFAGTGKTMRRSHRAHSDGAIINRIAVAAVAQPRGNRLLLLVTLDDQRSTTAQSSSVLCPLNVARTEY
jgi:hypothetical protein